MARSKGNAKPQNEKSFSKDTHKEKENIAHGACNDNSEDNDIKTKNDKVDFDKNYEKKNKDCKQVQRIKANAKQKTYTDDLNNDLDEAVSEEKNGKYNDEINDEMTQDEPKKQTEKNTKKKENTKKSHKNAAQKHSVATKKYNIEKMLDSGNVINLNKGDLKHLISAKNRYKTEIRALLIKKKKEILESLKNENEKILEWIPENIQKCPYISFLIGMKNLYNGHQIITKSKFDYAKKKPSVMIKIGDETIVIDDESLDKHKIVVNGQTNLTFVKQVKSLYEDYFGNKKIKKF